jgi:hypothetical protein
MSEAVVMDEWVEVNANTVLGALGHRWVSTGVVARALLLRGGRGVPWRERQAHHAEVREVLRVLEEAGHVRSRRVLEDGTPVGRDVAGRGRREWRLP